MNSPAYMTRETARALIAESRAMRERSALRKQLRQEFKSQGWSSTAAAELSEIHVAKTVKTGASA